MKLLPALRRRRGLLWPRRRWRRRRRRRFPSPARPISVTPDLAPIDAGVTSEAKTAREASDTNNAAMGKVLLAMKGAGSTRRISRPSGCRCSRNTRLTTGPHVVAIAPAIALPSSCARSPRSPPSSTRGRRGRQRDRRHQFHGLGPLETPRRRPHPGHRRRTAQGGDLCEGCRRNAGRSGQHHRRRLAPRRCSAARWSRAHGGQRRRWRKAKRRCR